MAKRKTGCGNVREGKERRSLRERVLGIFAALGIAIGGASAEAVQAGEIVKASLDGLNEDQTSLVMKAVEGYRSCVLEGIKTANDPEVKAEMSPEEIQEFLVEDEEGCKSIAQSKIRQAHLDKRIADAKARSAEAKASSAKARARSAQARRNMDKITHSLFLQAMNE